MVKGERVLQITVFRATQKNAFQRSPLMWLEAQVQVPGICQSQNGAGAPLISATFAGQTPSIFIMWTEGFDGEEEGS